MENTNDAKFKYKVLDNYITNDFQKRIRIHVERMHRDKIIDDDTKRFLIQTDPKPGRFYIFHKAHKQGNPGRPIVSHLAERISHFVDFHLKPLVQKTQSFIKDTLTNSNNLDNYPTMLFLSLLTSLLSTPTYPITKALTHVNTSLIHAFATLLLSVLKLYVTSYA